MSDHLWSAIFGAIVYSHAFNFQILICFQLSTSKLGFCHMGISHFGSVLVEISNLESETPIKISSKECEKQGINFRQIHREKTTQNRYLFEHKGRFLVIAEITRCHTFTKEINYASDHSQYVNENFYCKNCL